MGNGATAPTLGFSAHPLLQRAVNSFSFYVAHVEIENINPNSIGLRIFECSLQPRLVTERNESKKQTIWEDFKLYSNKVLVRFAGTQKKNIANTED